MNKKPIVLAVLASVTAETILSARHESTLVSQPHTEPDVHLTIPTTVSPISASGSGGAMSATLTYKPNELAIPPREHVEVNVSAQMESSASSASVGAGGGAATGIKITQIA